MTTGESPGGLAPPPAAGTKARRTHDRLLDATETLLGQGGYPAATSTAVAAAAGVSVGTFYTYFSDREHALAALFAARLDELIEAVGRALRLETLLDEGLGALVTGLVRVVVDGYDRHAATFRAALVQLPSSPIVRTVYWERHQRSEDVVTAFLRRAQQAGKVAVRDPAVMARSLLVLVQGLNTPLVLGRPGDEQRALTEEVVRALVGMLRPEAGTDH